MSSFKTDGLIFLALALVGIGLCWVVPSITVQIFTLFIMIVLAMTWDTCGGQMGYNSLGNIFFFGVGMYACVVVQVWVKYDVREWNSPYGDLGIVEFTQNEYLMGLGLGLIAAAIIPVICAALLGLIFFSLRGPYFAIGTLAMALAAIEIFTAWEFVGGGQGMSVPDFKFESPDTKNLMFMYLAVVLSAMTFFFLRWLYSTRFGLSINAIRDDEDKAEAMGFRTTRIKIIAWCTSAFFLGIAGALFGNIANFVEPKDPAFPTVTFGVFMVAMALLGGKGTIWGPVLGAILFQIIKEVTWTYLLGWQWVALGSIIIINVVFFQQGILGWARDRWPNFFGIEIEENLTRDVSGDAPEIDVGQSVDGEVS
ncbi:MAG: branched-chain amino acid ABC transporter permease [Alphaproteobacteria bacterium]